MKQHNDEASDVGLRGLLKHAKLRVTGMRLEILRVLSESEVALTAGQILERVSDRLEGPESSGGASRGGRGGRKGSTRRGLRDEDDPTADKVTVYRTLNSIVEANIAHRIDPGDRVFRYSLTDHAACTEHEHHHEEHPHMICEECGAVECIEDAEVIVRRRGGSKKGKGGINERAMRFRVSRQEITLRGTCERCLEKARS